MDKISFCIINGNNENILDFFNAAVFYDYTNIGITCELNQVRTFIIRFYKTRPDSRIRLSLSTIDDIILKIKNDDIENIVENVHDLREIILDMLSFEKLIKDNIGKLIIGNDNDNENE